MCAAGRFLKLLDDAKRMSPGWPTIYWQDAWLGEFLSIAHAPGR
jgi:hypothetical protein